MESVIRAGWGVKQGSFVSNWKLRFFVLRHAFPAEKDEIDSHITHMLLYFKSEQQAVYGEEPLGAVAIVKHATVVSKIRNSSVQRARNNSTSPGQQLHNQEVEQCIKIETKSKRGGKSIKPTKGKSIARSKILYMVPMAGTMGDWFQALTTLSPISHDDEALVQTRQKFRNRPMSVVSNATINRNDVDDDDDDDEDNNNPDDDGDGGRQGKPRSASLPKSPSQSRSRSQSQSHIQSHDVECLGVSKKFCERERARWHEMDPKRKHYIKLPKYMENVKKLKHYKSKKTAIYKHHLDEFDDVNTPMVDVATIFVSHPWDMLASQFFEVLLDRMSDNDYAWIDLYMCTQYNNGETASPTWIRKFENVIAETGNVVAILAPWSPTLTTTPTTKPSTASSSPSPLKRASTSASSSSLSSSSGAIPMSPMRRSWFLFELVCAIRSNATLELLLPKDDEVDLRCELLTNYKSVSDVIMDVQYNLSETTKLEDKQAITQVVTEMPGGAHEVDAVISEYLREWLSAKIISFVENGGDGIDFARLCNESGIILTNQGDYDKALECYFKGVTIKEKHLGKRHPSTANSYNNIGLVYTNKGNYAQALEYHFKSLAIEEQELGIDHADTAISYTNIGAVYEKQKDYNKAIEFYLKGISIQETQLGTGHRATGTSYKNVASIFRSRGDFEKALEFHFKAVAIEERLLGVNHDDTATSYTNIGVTHAKMGDADAALTFYFKALAVREYLHLNQNDASTSASTSAITTLNTNTNTNVNTNTITNTNTTTNTTTTTNMNTNTSGLVKCYKNIGVVYVKKSEYDKTLEYTLKALAIQEETLGIEHSDTGKTYKFVAAVYFEKGDYAKSIEYYTHCLSIVESEQGLNHVDVGNLCMNIAQVHIKNGDMNAAHPFFVRAVAVFEVALGPDHPTTIATRCKLVLV